MEKLGSPEVGGREGTPDREALFNLLTSERRPEGRKGGREIEQPRKDPEVGASQVWPKNSRRPGVRGRRAGRAIGGEWERQPGQTSSAPRPLPGPSPTLPYTAFVMQDSIV